MRYSAVAPSAFGIVILFALAACTAESIASSPPGSYLVMLEEDGGIALVEPNSGYAKREAEGATGDRIVAVGRDQRYVAVAGEDGRLRVHDLGAWPVATHVDLAPDAKARGMSFLDQRSRLIVACEQGSDLVIVNQLAGKVERRIALANAPSGLALSPDHHIAYVASASGLDVRAIEIESGREVARASLGGAPACIATSRRTGEVWVARANEPRIARLHAGDLQTEDSIESSRPLAVLAFTPDGIQAVGVDADAGGVSIFDAIAGRELEHVALDPTSAPNARLGPAALALDHRGRFAFVSLPAGGIGVVDLAARALTGSFQRDSRVSGLAWTYQPVRFEFLDDSRFR